MKESTETDVFKRTTRLNGGMLRGARAVIAMAVSGLLVSAVIMTAGCGKASSGNTVLPQAPYVIALSQPSGSTPGSLYALSPTQGTVTKLGLHVGLMPNSMLLDGETLYVVNAGDSTLSVISITESSSSIYMVNQGVIPLPPVNQAYANYPEYMTVTTFKGLQKGYVSLNGGNAVMVLNMNKNTVLGSIPIKPYTAWNPKFQPLPWGITAINNRIIVANNGLSYTDLTYAEPGMISVIDPSQDTVAQNITTADAIDLQAAAATSTGFVVIANGNYSTIGGYAALFDNAFTETAVIPLSGGGAGVAVSTTGIGYVALSSRVGYDEINTNAGTFITTTDLTRQVKGLTGYSLTSIKFAPDGTLWATDWSDNMVFEIDPQTNTVIKTFTLPEPAQDVVFVY